MTNVLQFRKAEKRRVRNLISKADLRNDGVGRAVELSVRRSVGREKGAEKDGKRGRGRLKKLPKTWPH